MVDIRMTLGKMILRRKKGVSPVIATILLIALTVTAAAIVYFVVVPLLTSKPELVPISYGKVSGTDDRYDVEFQNNGGAAANIEGITAITLDNDGTIINATHVFIGATEIIEWPWTLAQGDSVTWTIEFDAAFIGGESYTLTITYDSGKTLDFEFTY